MYQFSQSDPAFRSYVDSQFALLNAVSGSLLGSVRSVCDANVRLGQTMVEKSLSVGQSMLASASADGVPGAVAGGAEAASDTLPVHERDSATQAADTHVDPVHAAQRDEEQASGTAPVWPDHAGPQNGGQDPGSGMRSERRKQPERRASKASHGGQPAA
ncbi:hypothetical protein [Herbaspirillum sp. SJZ107]|uniref:hypothetical protein n=1 Tax=Herbaspirillum sp. SJZ107 TaxID=2572881 RepID=UPI00115220A2|nr:hypothetical protein [Herbaspirillum sp. SJZ107]TQK08237.1 hypothetical protein FBX97_3550 [Herbaspirillum sp. SJZ107]